jgi:hypothetical protein
MTVQKDVIEGLKGEMSKWNWEADEAYAKKRPKPMYSRIANVRPHSDLNMGGYYKGTSAIGSKSLQKRAVYGKLYRDNPADGFTVYATGFDATLRFDVPLELDRSWKRTKDFLRDYIKKNIPSAIEEFKEDLVFEQIRKGGLTSGDACFSQANAAIAFDGYTTANLPYDAKPWFALSGNNHTAKSGSTYYNALAVATTDFALAKAMWELYVHTNAYMENGQPIDLRDDVIVVTAGANELDWDIINNSTLQPDTAENPKNPLKGKFTDIIASNRITTTTMSVIGKKQGMLEVFFGEPQFNYWEENDPPARCASVILPYAITIQNFRFAVSNNAPFA